MSRLSRSGRPERETDPYGHITWALNDPRGNGDLICFDYYVNAAKGTVRIHSVINCETGHFIEDFANVVVPLDEALAEAQRQIDAAVDWFFDNGYPRFVGKRNMAKFLKHLAADLVTR
jgi:hypothetical protein